MYRTMYTQDIVSAVRGVVVLAGDTRELALYGGLTLHRVLFSLAGKQSPAGVICATMDGPCRQPCRTVPPALAAAFGIFSSCCYILNVNNHPS